MKDNVITREDFEFRKRINLPYEGFVEGLGYVAPKPVTVQVSKNPYYNLYSVENSIAYIIIPLSDEAIPAFRGKRMPKVVEEQKHPQEAEADKTESKVVTVAASGETFADKQAQIREAMKWKLNGDQMRGQIFVQNMIYETMPRLNFLASTGIGAIDLGAGFHHIGQAFSSTTSKIGTAFKGGNVLSVSIGITLDGFALDANRISLSKFYSNSLISLIAFGLGKLSAPIGLVLSVGYFGVDNYYQGGWEGYGRDMARRHQIAPYAEPKY